MEAMKSTDNWRLYREQLLALWSAGMTWPGDLISKTATQWLVDNGYACLIGDYYALTQKGQHAVRNLFA